MLREPGLFGDIAQRALLSYDLPVGGLVFVRHSDNVTFRVETLESEAYLLRLHVPITAAMGSHGADPEAINSELLWLEALHEETDLVLQRPIRNRDGALVSQLPVGAGEAAVNCTLLSWVEGRPYTRDLETEQTARQIGTMMATLHRQASQWRLPAGLTRPKRDIAYFQAMLRGLEPAVDDGRISRSDYAEFETAVGLLGDMMGSLSQDRATHGIMHADAHKGNLLYHGGEIRLIDFSFCALGDFMFDLGVCFSDMQAGLRRVCLESYQSLRPLPDGYQRLIEGFFVGGMVGTFCYWVPNPQATELLVTRVPRIAREAAARFNRGEIFWSW